VGVEVAVGEGMFVGWGVAGSAVGVEGHQAAFGVHGFDAVLVGARVDAFVGARWDGDWLGARAARGLAFDSGGSFGVVELSMARTVLAVAAI